MWGKKLHTARERKMTITVNLPSNTTSSSLTLGNKNYKLIGGSNNVDDTLIVGNGIDKYIGGDNNTGGSITLGAGADSFIGGNSNTGVTVTLGNGNDVFKGGNNDTDITLTLGNGNDALRGGNDGIGNNVTLGNGIDTIYSGSNNTLSTTTVGSAGKGSLTFFDVGSNNTDNTNHFNGTVVWYIDGNSNNTNNTTFFGNHNVTMILEKAGTGNSADNVFAGNGNDILFLAPNSQLTAGNGVDKVHANQNDTIALGNGNDTVHAGPNDTINLGTGVDTIVFAVSPYPLFIGEETIDGFSPAHDVIKINHTLIGSFKGVLADAHQVGADTVITIDASNAITLTGVAVSSLHGHNFLFV
jgi:Ca2+-binding RTX toxin-like protein